MQEKKPITVVIIDDEPEAIINLKLHLDVIPGLKIVGTATRYQKGIHLITECKPDLLFLDVEMPGKNGFELLGEIEKRGLRNGLTVVFHTAYDKYTVQALRESAFDFLLKPPTSAEVNETIRRFRETMIKKSVPDFKPSADPVKKIVALPTATGLLFVPKAEIVYFECLRSAMGIRSSWTCVFNDQQTIRLRANIKSGSIIHNLGDDNFIQLSQSVIVSISFISSIEYKTYECFLFPPFDHQPFKISRRFMGELRERFDVI